MHPTNGPDAFITVADDGPSDEGTALPEMSPPTIARLQFEMTSRIRIGACRRPSHDPGLKQVKAMKNAG
jgi:hypothetical protein